MVGPMMERDWGRRRPFVQLGLEDVQERVRLALPGASVLAIEPLTAGLRNTNYRVRLDGREKSVVLRLFTGDAAACQREAALFGLLKGRAIPMPAVLYAQPHADPPFAIASWIDGVGFDTLLGTADENAIGSAAYGAGKALARIHAVSYARPGWLGPTLEIAAAFGGGIGWAGDIIGLLEGPAGVQIGEPLAERLRVFARQHAAQIDLLNGPASLVHADYKPWNLLVRQDGQGCTLAGVVDWEGALAGPPLMDFGIFLRGEADWPPAYADGFVAGYLAAGGQLPQNWRELAKLLDLLNVCSMLIGPAGETAARDLRGVVQTTLDAYS
jgi:aminoglycoside phosphotransferase (APT) family kinase protein